MMTAAELYTALNTITEIKNKVRYRAFAPGALPALPYVTYIITNSDNMAADNKAYFPMDAVDVELYTSKKDLTLEGKIEALFDAADVVWSRSDSYQTTDEVYETIYSITLRR